MRTWLVVMDCWLGGSGFRWDSSKEISSREPLASRIVGISMIVIIEYGNLSKAN